MHGLKHAYPIIQNQAQCSYGGNQRWLRRRDLQQCGCGVVAMADLALYLTRHHGFDGPEEAVQDPVPLEAYDRLCSRLQLRYLPMVPPLGITGVGLAAGIGLYFRMHGIPLQAFWGVRTKNLWSAMADMLDRDLPVIFAIGPNFPIVWAKHRLNLYRKTPDGRYVAVSRVKGHYITATGLDETWVQISSWGKEYYIHREEYEQYGKQHSLSLTNNLLWLRKKQVNA